MKHLNALYLCAVVLQLGSCTSSSQDPTPATPRVVVRYTAVGADTSRAVVQVRTYSHTRPDSTVKTVSNATTGAGKVTEWWVGAVPEKYDLTASILFLPCGLRRQVLPAGATLTLEILVNEKVVKSVDIKSGVSPMIAPIQTDVTLRGGTR